MLLQAVLHQGDTGGAWQLRGISFLFKFLVDIKSSYAVEGSNSIFQKIRKRDIFLHHPYNSIETLLELIEKAIKHKPNSGYIIDSLGWVYFRKGLYARALIELKKAVELSPKDPAIHEHRVEGTALRRGGKGRKW